MDPDHMESEGFSESGLSSKGDEGDDEGDDQNVDEEDEEDEEDEPKLKYQRLGASVSGILQNDRAKCLIPHDKFLVLGTEKGMVYILDLVGNEIMRMQVHTSPINDMSLDGVGEYVATCSDDGTVAISDIWSDKSSKSSKHLYYRPVRAVALPASYKQHQMFSTGGLNQQFIVNTKAWFSNRDNVIHSGEGPIYAISWKGDLIAWANNLGVKIYDCGTQDRIAFINRPQGSAPANVFRCHLCWADHQTLIMGWGDSVKIGVVKQRGGFAPTGPQQKATRSRFLQIIALFRTDFFISGIAPFGPDHLALLAHVQESNEDEDKDEDDGEEAEAQRPELRIMSWGAKEVSSDGLPINGYQNNNANDYRLQYLHGAGVGEEEEFVFYIMSPEDIVMARPRDLDDHVAWLLARGRFERALKASEEGKERLKHHKFIDIVHRYLDHLFEEGEYETAAAACTRLLGSSAQLWEKRISLFAQHRQIKAISQYIPTSQPQLSEYIYEMVLNHFLREEPEALCATITHFPAGVYNVKTIIQATKAHLSTVDHLLIAGSAAANETLTPQDLTAAQTRKQQHKRYLLEALSMLYQSTENYAEAVGVYLQLGDSDVFELVRKLKLFDTIREQLLLLMNFNAEMAQDLLTDNTDHITVDEVISQLKDHPRLQHSYLHALFLKDPMLGFKYHEKQVGLYAEYQPDQLLAFLKSSNCYLLEDALQICERKHLYKEMVYLLRKMGDLEYALTLLIEKLHDVKAAVAFVEEHKDEQLWDQLIDRSLGRAEFLSDLLENVGSHYVDMHKLVSRIPSQLVIPGLKQKIIQILADQRAQANVRKGCNSILRGDSMALQTRLVLQQRGGISVTTGEMCLLCKAPILSHWKREAVVVFMCQHTFHQSCIEAHGGGSGSEVFCTICNQEQGGVRKRSSS